MMKLPRTKEMLRLLLLIIITAPCCTYGQVSLSYLQNDKSMYAPGDTVKTTVTFSSAVTGAALYREYYHLSEMIFADSVTAISGAAYQVNWLPPATDYKGYLFKLILRINGIPSDTANIAIDVSSDWKRFPRYGFLSKYPVLTSTDAAAIIGNLSRHHINGIQYYDWQWKHHKPLRGEPGSIYSSWPNIANQTNYLSTIQKYIAACSSRNINSMAYNLLYGAYASAAADSVSDQWRIFSDVTHLQPDFHDLPSTWASDIYIMDPSNSNWVRYINKEMQKVFLGLNFNGWHIDQLGDRGTRYNFSGQAINMTAAFKSFTDSAKVILGVPLVFNAVTNYGQTNIAKAPVDFLYSEVWNPYNSYSDLVSLVNYNYSFSNKTKNSVLAAYVNKGISGTAGYFNPASVLFTNAVIFASGGSHIELGEHMLSHEYFPTNKLQMSADLKASMVRYYDFLTAYENILRDDLNPYAVDISSPTHPVTTWPPQQGRLWAYPRAKGKNLIVQVINFKSATTMYWQDNTAIQAVPALLENIQFRIPVAKTVSKVWYASPDNDLIVPQNIAYTADTDGVTVTLPKLKYWSTIVVEFEGDLTGSAEKTEPRLQKNNLLQNYPNPFNAATEIRYSISADGDVSVKIFDMLGNEAATLLDAGQSAGEHTLTFDSAKLSAGVYFCVLKTSDYCKTNKMVLLK